MTDTPPLGVHGSSNRASAAASNDTSMQEQNVAAGNISQDDSHARETGESGETEKTSLPKKQKSLQKTPQKGRSGKKRSVSVSSSLLVPTSLENIPNDSAGKKSRVSSTKKVNVTVDEHVHVIDAPKKKRGRPAGKKIETSSQITATQKKLDKSISEISDPLVSDGKKKVPVAAKRSRKTPQILKKNTEDTSETHTSNDIALSHTGVHGEADVFEPVTTSIESYPAKTTRSRGRGKKTSTKKTTSTQETVLTLVHATENGSTTLSAQNTSENDSPMVLEESLHAPTPFPQIFDQMYMGEILDVKPVLSHQDMSTDLRNVQDEAGDDVEHDVSQKERRARRGSRGGRGKRGRKGALDVVDLEVDAPVIEEKSVHKAGTSLTAGKPGRAQASTKKTTQNVGQRKMFISVVPGEQVEVALLEEGGIHEYYLEMLHQIKTKGNIYKGIIHNIDTNLQAAFVNYGGNKNGFLQIDEIHPEYFQIHHESTRGKRFPPIQKALKQGQEVLVQVVKEPTGNKGAFLTTWLSLAGRFLVLTPGQEQIGISRKVENEEERSRLRELMAGIEPGVGLGAIVRTVSAGTSKTTLKNDLQYLKRVWREIRKRGVNEVAPQLIYQEPDLAERSIRDYLTDDVSEVWVDNADVAENLRETVALLFPRKKDLVRIHADVRQTLWERFNIQRQLEQIYSREVVLPSGGRLVFDQTEALMAIDINSGKISGKVNFESMALKTNLEAAEAIARHLKLRDIGGQIVIDFIEMRDKAHVREVEKTLRTAMKNDRARHDVARMSSFGLLEIVRQRTGSSALAITMESCPHCRGTGTRRNLEWQALRALREISRQGHAHTAGIYVYETSSELALYLLNKKKQRLCQLEEQLQKHVEIRIRT